MSNLKGFVLGTIFGIYLSQNYKNIPNIKYYINDLKTKIEKYEKK